MSRAVDRALQAASGVVLAGGLLLGGMSMPLGSFGCAAAFDSMAVETGDTLDFHVACADQRAERQEAAVAFLVLGLAGVVGAEVHLRASRSARPAEVRPAASS